MAFPRDTRKHRITEYRNNGISDISKKQNNGIQIQDCPCADYAPRVHMSLKQHPFTELQSAVGSTYKTYLFILEGSQRGAILTPTSRLKLEAALKA